MRIDRVKLLLILFLSVFLAVSVLFSLSFYFSIQLAREQLSSQIDHLGPEFAQAMVHGDLVLQRRIFNSMLSSFEQYTLLLDSKGAVLERLGLETGTCSWKIDKEIVHQGAKVGEVHICLKGWDIFFEYSHRPNFVGTFVCLVIVFYFIIGLPLFLYLRRISAFLEKIEFLENVSASDTSLEMDKIAGSDMLLRKVVSFVKLGMSLRELREKSELAAQVAHDIRSPLAALSMAERDLSALPEETRLMIRSAVGRIKDIANELLKKNRENMQIESLAGPETIEKPSVLLLASLLDSVITEKRMQFRTHLNLVIEANLDRGAYGLFVEVNSGAFKRVISNLINNAVEAIQNSKQADGRVIVTAKRLENSPNLATEQYDTGEKIRLTIEDNGPGIPESIIVKLGTRGETHGKEGGNGLGVYHAMQTVRAMGGEIVVESSHAAKTFDGSGTRIHITVPGASQPAWFVQKIVLTEKTQVVVLDDDDSIHQIWNGRFDSAMATKQGVNLVHFSDISALKAWHLGGEKNGLATLYLFDYEILGDSRTGLDLIEELGLGSKAILVTSRFEEPEIRNRCERLGVRLIPKGLSGFVPIELEKSAIQSSGDASPAAPKLLPKLLEIDFVLIDDDALIHSLWQSQAKRAGKKIFGVYSESELTPFLKKLAKSCPIYVDSNLAKNQKGEEVAKRLFDLGFENIYLTTGYHPSHFGPMPWVKGIVGKETPF